MRITRTLGWFSLFAGVATYLATRAAMRKREEQERAVTDESTRWETDGGATASGPQPPATF